MVPSPVKGASKGRFDPGPWWGPEISAKIAEVAFWVDITCLYRRRLRRRFFLGAFALPNLNAPNKIAAVAARLATTNTVPLCSWYHAVSGELTASSGGASSRSEEHTSELQSQSN